MGNLLNIVTPLHTRTRREYLPRMTAEKPGQMSVAKRFGREFWDGPRQYGYGGYGYDGRWKGVAERLIQEYGLKDDAAILDVGCGKGYLLFEFKQLLANAIPCGLDISRYAVQNAKSEIQDGLLLHPAQTPYPFKDKQFDLVISLTTLHNLKIFDLGAALKEIDRVGKHQYLTVESFKNDSELFNLQCWALTCQSFYAPDEWKWIFDHFGYTGDYEFIYFE